ncbi:MAG: winged helix DNA-binding domain-containing protein [bacterium]|nr:winged helix DNA-binding domain-containing protein [bacterium]
MNLVRLARSAVLTARLARHGLTCPVDTEAGYVELFRRLQPVSPEANSYPGSAPRLMHRTTAGIVDSVVADDLRSRRQLVKGRFHGGTVGYVHSDDLPLYAAAYRQPLEQFDARQEAALRALTCAGPLSPRQLRHETGLAHRPLMAAVHRLERAFIICEDQTDSAWDRPLHLVDREFPELWAQAPPAEVAQAEVLARLLAAQVLATTAELAAGSGLGKRCVAGVLAGMEEDHRIEVAAPDDDGEQGWRLAEDDPGAADNPAGVVRVLHLRDPLVRPRLDEQSQRFEGREVLQYLLIDNDIHGAACGHWRIKAHDVEDVLITDRYVARWQSAAIDAVRQRYPEPDQHVLACNGVRL